MCQVFGNRGEQSVGSLKELLQKVFPKNKLNKHTGVLAIICIVGMGLLLLPTGKETKEENEVLKDVHLYREQTEQKLSRMLSRVKGVGHAEVMITLQDEGQTFYAENEEELKDGTKENFAASYVLKNEGSGKEGPLIEKQTAPEIAGVFVVASGAKDPAVKMEIISAVRAVLGVKIHRIEVLEMK